MKNNYKIENALNTLFYILILCYWLGTIYNFRKETNPMFYIALRLLINIGCFILVFVKKKTIYEETLVKREVLLIIFFVIFGCLSSIYNNNLECHTYLFIVLSGAGIGMGLAHFGIEKKVALMLFVVLCIVLLNYYRDYGNLSLIWNSMSCNYVSVFLLSITFLVFLSYGNSETWLMNIFALITLLFSCLAVGRGGILSAAILNLICAFIILRYSKSKEKIKSILFYSILSILILLSILLLDWDFNSFFLGKFYRVGFVIDEARATYFHDYLLQMDNIGNILFGAEVKEHLHNTYLMFHSRFGIICLLIFIVLFFRAIKYNWKYGNKMMIAIILAIMIRISTDTIFTISIFDSTFFYIIFLGVREKGMNIRKLSKFNSIQNL